MYFSLRHLYGLRCILKSNFILSSFVEDLNHIIFTFRNHAVLPTKLERCYCKSCPEQSGTPNETQALQFTLKPPQLYPEEKVPIEMRATNGAKG